MISSLTQQTFKSTDLDLEYPLFLISSVVHFRHDMPIIFPKSDYITSILLIEDLY